MAIAEHGLPTRLIPGLAGVVHEELRLQHAGGVGERGTQLLALPGALAFVEGEHTPYAPRSPVP